LDTGVIVNRIVGLVEALPGHVLVAETGEALEIGGSYVDGVYAPPAPVREPPTPEEIIEGFRRAIQSHVDAVAQERNYDSGTSLAGYVVSTNPAWAAEAQAFVAWRDAVWVYAYAELDKVAGGQRQVQDVEDFVTELPEMVWPG
jgi:hypothetical protein